MLKVRNRNIRKLSILNIAINVSVNAVIGAGLLVLMMRNRKKELKK